MQWRDDRGRLERPRLLQRLLKPTRADVLVFAPHPDDEVIGCGGVIQHALAEGRRVRVAFTTSGDGYPRAAAKLLMKPESDLTPDDFRRLGARREAEAIAAAKVLGLDASQLAFLRHPDAQLGKLPAEARTSALQGVQRVIEESQPSRVYVTDHGDEHPDHRVTNELVREAVALAGSVPEVFTYLVHSGGDTRWPLPGPRYETSAMDGITYPTGVRWPPPVRVDLTPSESERKLRALVAHESQWALDHDYLARFVKSEEIFWRVAIQPGSGYK